MGNTAHPYEGIYILNSEMNEEAQKEFFKKNASIVKTHSGEFSHVDTWGRRRLANPIKKQGRGVYFHALFTADNSGIAELERNMRINEGVLRFFHKRLKVGTNLKQYHEDFHKRLADTKAKDQAAREKRKARDKSDRPSRPDR